MASDGRSLAPLLEKLLTAGFAHLTPQPVTVLASEWNYGDDEFEPPITWRMVRESSEKALPARASALFYSGPVLLLPSWESQLDATQPRGVKGRRNSLPYEDTLCACAPADSGSVMAIMTPVNLWTSDGRQASDLRRALGEHWDALFLIYSTGLLRGIDPRFVSATAFLCAKAPRRPPLKLFRVPRWEDESAIVKDFETLLARGGGRTRHGYVLREPPSHNESLDFDRHDPIVLKQRADLAGFGSVSLLGDLCDMVPQIHKAGDSDLLSAEAQSGTVRLVDGSDVQRNGSVAPPSDRTYWVRARPEHLLVPGDLVLREIYSPGDPHGLIVAEVTEQDLPAAASHTTIVLRPRAEVERQRIRFVVMFLRTPLARTLAGMSGSHVTVRRLMELPVPQPDEALEKAFNDLDGARLQLAEWQEKADSLLESVFAHQTPAQARSEIMDQGRALRLRVEAATLLDELGHTVRTRFPYPVASRWRETEARMSTGDLNAAYGAVLDTAEILLCYLALTALAIGRAEGINFGAMSAIREKLASGRNGPGFGDWVAVLDEAATARHLRNLPAEHPLQDIRGLLTGADVTDARKRLYGRRNDQAHLRRIDPIDLPVALQGAFEELATLTEKARFLADSPLLHITDVRWDTLEKVAQVRFRELMGDHPVVPTKTMVVPSSDVEKGSLYLRDSGHRLHLLRPFLIGQDCPVCRSWSTFHVDRVTKKAVSLKCLERGHTFTTPSPTMPTVLNRAGLL